MPKFYITTPIYYVNDKPTIGHAYTAIAADVLARYHRLLGEEVFFTAGTDENSQKNFEAASRAGLADNIPEYLNRMAALWQQTFDTLGLTHDRFIRTTEPAHILAVEKFWRAVAANGDIYEGKYNGLYCVGCEAFVVESELVDGHCPLHKRVPEKLQETNYFFRLSKYRDALLEYIGAHPDFILPAARRHEVVNYIRDFMTDISISRQSVPCGIPVPDDESQRIYVWFDALINYLTAAGYPELTARWPADLHLVGKDIIKFHCALWPAMLLSAGLPLPQHIFAHGFFTVNGEKMSKSLGNAVDPLAMVAKFDNDTLRFFLLREIRFGEDGDFSLSRLSARYDGDLANELGNLVHRVLTMAEKYCGGVVPARADGYLRSAWGAYQAAMEEFRLHDALDVAWRSVRAGNQFIDEKQPWVLAKLGEEKMLAEVIYILLETLRHIAWMLWPFLPLTSELMLGKLGQSVSQTAAAPFPESWAWGKLEPGTRLVRGAPLFPRRGL